MGVEQWLLFEKSMLLATRRVRNLLPHLLPPSGGEWGRVKSAWHARPSLPNPLVLVSPPSPPTKTSISIWVAAEVHRRADAGESSCGRNEQAGTSNEAK